MEHSQTDDYDILVFDALVSGCLGFHSANAWVCVTQRVSQHSCPCRAARFFFWKTACLQSYRAWHLLVHPSVLLQLNSYQMSLYLPCECLGLWKCVTLSAIPFCLSDTHYRPHRWQKVPALQHSVGGLHQAAFQRYISIQVGYPPPAWGL